jgi:hypothetical protein
MIECCSNQKREIHMEQQSAAQQIDAILNKYADWRGELVSRLCALIKQADPAFVEEVKWKKPSRRQASPRVVSGWHTLLLRYPQERRQVDLPQGGLR